jgi:hypothetical protein
MARMKFWAAVIVLTLPIGEVDAMTAAAPIDVVCPLTGEHFTTYGGSFSCSGRSMDFEPSGKGCARPFPIPQCPDSGLPIYRTFTLGELSLLRKTVSSSEWKQRLALAKGNTHYLTAYIQEILGEDKKNVANSLLTAFWTSNNENRAFLLNKAIEWWRRLASDDEVHDRNWVIANWLNVDLNRQAGHFDEAASALRDVRTKMPIGFDPVTPAMMDYEQQLINTHNTMSATIPLSAKSLIVHSR